MNNPKFSIIISVYNKIKELQECINVLSGQIGRCGDFEIIVINDGGKNEVQAIVKEQENKIIIKYFYIAHKGPAAARNFGIQKSTGDVIIFLDADSVPDKNWTNAMEKAWKLSGDADAIGGCIAIDSKDSILCKVSSDYCNWYLKQCLSGGYSNFLLTGNAGYKKDALEKINGFDETFKNAAGEDRDLNVRLSKMGFKLKVDENIKVYHDKGVSLGAFIKRHYIQGRMSYKFRAKHPNTQRLSLKSYIDFYKSIPLRYKFPFDAAIACFLFTLLQIVTVLGYFKAAIAGPAGKENGFHKIGNDCQKERHLPLTKRLDINFGYVCNNNCLFCYFRNRKKDCRNISNEKAKSIMLRAKKCGIDTFEITGGEPTIREDIIDLVSYAKDTLGVKNITIITNGSRFCDNEFAAKMVKAGIDDVLLSVHGHAAEIHDALTDRKGSFENVLKTIQNVVKLGISCRTNTVITSRNYKNVSDIASLVLGLGVKKANFIFFAPLDDARVVDKTLWVRYCEAAAYIKKLIDDYKNNFETISIKAIPFCFLEGYEDYFTYYYQNNYDPYEWDYYIRVGIRRNRPLRDLAAVGGMLLFTDLPRLFKIGFKKGLREGIYNIEGFRHCTKPSECKKCRFDLICPGIWKVYAKHFDSNELKAVRGKKIKDIDYPLLKRFYVERNPRQA